MSVNFTRRTYRAAIKRSLHREWLLSRAGTIATTKAWGKQNALTEALRSRYQQEWAL